jgi:membrane protein YdbS with pleckstrin-like domain
VPEPVETTDPDGVDHTWVMQVTFVLALAVGAPVVAVLSAGTPLPTWTDKAVFAARVGAVVWLAIAGVVYAYARSRVEDDDEDGENAGDGADDAARGPD